MSFEVGPGMGRPTPPHPPTQSPMQASKFGVTPPPKDGWDKPDPWYARYILFPLFLLVIVAGVMAWTFRYQITRKLLTPDQSQWPTAMATVTKTAVDSSGQYEMADNSWYRNRHESRYQTGGYVPEVDFTFTVGDKSYLGSSLSCLPRVYDYESSAKRTLDNYPEKSQLEIHYNPQNPSDNVVDQARSDLMGTWSDSRRY